MLYLRFAVCLAAGLFGVALVLRTLIDTLLTDWDVAAEVQRVINDISKKKKVGVLAGLQAEQEALQ